MHLQDDHGGGDGQAAVLHRDGLAGQGVFIAAVGQGDGHGTRTARQGEHAHGQVLPLSDSFRMPMRSRDGRERVLLGHMTEGLLQIQVPLRESGVWSVTQDTVNEALPAEAHMRFAGMQVFAIEA